MTVAGITQLSVEYSPIETAIHLDFAAEVLDPAGLSPADIIRSTDAFKLRATIKLTGGFCTMLAGKIAVQANIENYGPGPWSMRAPVYKDLDPCGDGVYVWDFDFAPGDLPAEGLGSVYTVAFTFATQNLCGQDGAIHGWARELQFEVRP